MNTLENLTFDEFAENMKWNTGDWTVQEIKTVYNSVDGESFDTLEQAEQYTMEQGADSLYDVNLTAVIDYYTDAGYQAKDIVQMIDKPVMMKLELYYCKEDDLFVSTVMM